MRTKRAVTCFIVFNYCHDSDRFLVGGYNKLAAKKINPVELLEKINLNTYRLRVLGHIRTADVFNVKHLIPFFDDCSKGDTDCTSRSTFLSPGEDDAAVARLWIVWKARIDARPIVQLEGGMSWTKRDDVAGRLSWTSGIDMEK